uniref:CUB domain-containing protein n=2 Tax=Panagrellus redivivus TaxID=6233 RepID=A0A7E4UWW2_PANRE
MDGALFILVIFVLRSVVALRECEGYRVLLGAFSDNCQLATIDLCEGAADYEIVQCDLSFCLMNNGIPNLEGCPGYESADVTSISTPSKGPQGVPIRWHGSTIWVTNKTLEYQNQSVVLTDFGNIVNLFFLKTAQKRRPKRHVVEGSKMWLRLKTGKTPEPPDEKKKKMPLHLLIIICVVVTFLALIVLCFCIIGCIYVCRRLCRKSGDSFTHSRESRSRSRRIWENFKSLFKKKRRKPRSVFSTHSNQPISGVAFDVVPAEPVVAVKGNPTPQRFMSPENNQSLMGTTGNDSSHTSYEEAVNQDVEQVDDPLYIPGFRAKGPLAPDHIDAEKFKHRGQLVLKKRQKVNLHHDLANDSYHQPKSTDHIKFDSQMNEVIDFGPGVEQIISNKSKSSTRSCSTAPSRMPMATDFVPTAPAITPKKGSLKSAKSKTPAISSRRKGRRVIPPPPPPARAQPMPTNVRPVLPVPPAPQPAHAQPMPKSEMTQPKSATNTTAPFSEPQLPGSSEPNRPSSSEPNRPSSSDGGGKSVKSQKTQQESMMIS